MANHYVSRRLFTIIFIVTSTIISRQSYAGGEHSIKGGIHISRILFTDKGPDTEKKHYEFDHSYPVNYSFGVFYKTQIKGIKIQTGLYFLKTNCQYTYYSDIEDLVRESVIFASWRIPLLFNLYQNKKNTLSIITGPDIGLNQEAKIHQYSKLNDIVLYNHSLNHIPFIDLFFCMGLNKMVSNHYFLELKYLVSITEYENMEVGSWRNNTLQFLIGYKFN